MAHRLVRCAKPVPGSSRHRPRKYPITASFARHFRIEKSRSNIVNNPVAPIWQVCHGICHECFSPAWKLAPLVRSLDPNSTYGVPIPAPADRSIDREMAKSGRFARAFDHPYTSVNRRPSCATHGRRPLVVEAHRAKLESSSLPSRNGLGLRSAVKHPKWVRLQPDVSQLWSVLPFPTREVMAVSLLCEDVQSP